MGILLLLIKDISYKGNGFFQCQGPFRYTSGAQSGGPDPQGDQGSRKFFKDIININNSLKAKTSLLGYKNYLR